MEKLRITIEVIGKANMKVYNYRGSRLTIAKFIEQIQQELQSTECLDGVDWIAIAPKTD
jgi:hypothetical protein